MRVPDCLAFSKIKGYEAWQVIAVSRSPFLLVAILGNPEMIAAYQARVSGRPTFPDSTKMAKFPLEPEEGAEDPDRRWYRTPCMTSISS